MLALRRRRVGFGLILCLAATKLWAQQGGVRPFDRLVVTAVGDLVLGTTFPKVMLPPNDGEGMFAAVELYLKDSADIIFGNLEGPMLEGGVSTKCRPNSQACYAFRMPSAYVRHLKQAGFNALNIATNHARDFGDDGLQKTVQLLRAHQIQPVGGIAVAEFNVRGKKIAILGFSPYIYTYSYSLLEIPKAKDLVAQLKKTHDIVIVSVQGGAEGPSAQRLCNCAETFYGEARGNLRAFAHAVIDAGADLVLGHGPHVLRAFEVYKERFIAYSLGNFLVYGPISTAGPNGISLVLRVDIDLQTGKFIGGRMTPVILRPDGLPKLDPQKQALPLLQKLSKEDVGCDLSWDERGFFRLTCQAP